MNRIKNEYLNLPYTLLCSVPSVLKHFLFCMPLQVKQYICRYSIMLSIWPVLLLAAVLLFIQRPS